MKFGRSESEKFVKQLENEFLTSVTFMNGYLAIGFSIGALTAQIPPTIIDKGNSWKWQQPGYNDKLISLIETKVVFVELNEKKEYFKITLEKNTELLISFNDHSVEVPEAFILNINSELLVV